MLKLELLRQKRGALKVLCLGAHSDDIEIGCGGTILRLLEEYNNVEIYWVIFAAKDQRGSEAKESANLFLSNAGQKTVLINGFKDGFFPYMGNEIKEYFEDLKEKFSPDLIVTHHRNDLHQDHRLISDMTWHTFRDHLIFSVDTS